MKGNRILTALVLAAIGIPAIYFGGIWFFIPFAVLLCIAAWEFARLFQAVDVQASGWLGVAGVFVILATRVYWPELATAALALLMAAALVFHLVAYERGRDRAATDFAASLADMCYLGWFGAYLLQVRGLPGGAWWFLLCLGPVWIADSAAFYVGRSFGRHKMTPRLSPKKPWEGYAASAVGGTLGGMGLAALFSGPGSAEVPLRWTGAMSTSWNDS